MLSHLVVLTVTTGSSYRYRDSQMCGVDVIELFTRADNQQTNNLRVK